MSVDTLDTRNEDWIGYCRQTIYEYGTFFYDSLKMCDILAIGGGTTLIYLQDEANIVLCSSLDPYVFFYFLPKHIKKAF